MDLTRCVAASPMARLLLDIGLTKTGSTTIQAALRENRKYLRW